MKSEPNLETKQKNLKTKDDEFDEEYVDEVSDKDEKPHKEINNADSVILSAVFCYNIHG